MFFPRTGVGSFILTFFWTSVSSKESLYGCDVNTFAQSGMINPMTGEFGYLDPSNILMFKNEQDFQKFNDKISNIFSEFKTNREYDSLSSYFRFYQTYTALKECPGYNGFQSFYQRYLMENFPYEEAGGNAIQLMKKLTRQVPGMAQSAYFVARSEISEVNLTSLRNHVREASIHSLKDIFRPDQIAVVIKFKIEGASGNGFIILDPEIPIRNPAVFRLDRNPSVSQYQVDRVHFTIVESSNKPLAESKLMIAFVQHGTSDDLTLYDMYIYDIKRPYCTLVETTMKSSLLGFTHSKEELDSNGMSSVKLVANIGVSAGGQTSTYDVKLIFFDQHGTKSITIPHWTYNLYEIQSFFRDDLQKFCMKSGTKRGDRLDSVIAKDLELLNSIYRDKEFLLQCERLKKQALPVDAWGYEENNSWAVLSELDPEAKNKKKTSFRMPTKNMLWRSLERADQKSRCESYGYGP